MLGWSRQSSMKAIDGNVGEGLGTSGVVSIFSTTVTCLESPSVREISRFLGEMVMTRRDISFVWVEDSLVVLGKDDTILILNERVSLPTFQTV
jgi:hypothetical protein